MIIVKNKNVPVFPSIKYLINNLNRTVQNIPFSNMHVRNSVIILVSVLCRAYAHTTASTKDVSIEDISNIDMKLHNSNEAIKQVWEKRCSRQYGVGCLKLDLVRLIDRLDGNTNFQLLPGVSLTRSSSNAIGISPEVINYKSDSFIDNYLISKVTNYLTSLSISVKILDPALVTSAKSFSEGIFGPDPDNTVTARRKNRFGQTLATAGLMSGGTMLALGMTALAAMAGKALMTSLLSLMLSALSALKSSGEGHKSTTYEIVTKPLVSHAHMHTSEVQHVTGHGGHAAHDSGYGYARSMASTPVQPVVNQDIYEKNSETYEENKRSQMAYRAHYPTPSSYSSVSSSVSSSTDSPPNNSQEYR